MRLGSVELLIGGRLFDVLGEGEMFGFASVLEEGPLGFVARAADAETLVYRIPAHAIRPVLERPEAARFIARTMSAGMRLLAGSERDPAPDAGGRPARELLRAPAVVCPPDTSVGDAARRMVEAGATCVVVDLGDRFGIVTDRDIRTRVLAEGAGPDAPLAQVMTAPAWTFAADRSGTEALIEMLDHGIRHLLVLESGRRLLGVLDDVDLMASERRAPFRLRALVARSPDADAVAAAAAGLPRMVIDLHDGGQPAAAISRTLATLHDSITRRLIELAHAELGPPPVPYTWLATGSFGRREPFPSSDVDSALAWEGPDGDEELSVAHDDARAPRHRRAPGVRAAAGRARRRRLEPAVRALDRRLAGGRADVGRGSRSRPRPDAALGCRGEQPGVGRDARAPGARGDLRDGLRAASRCCAASPPPRSPSGRRRACCATSCCTRAASARACSTSSAAGCCRSRRWRAGAGSPPASRAASTRARLDASEAAGTLAAADAAILRDAFDLVCALRMEHQVEQLRAGHAPDDLIAPGALTPLTRSALKAAFRAVARVQRGISVQLGLGPR